MIRCEISIRLLVSDGILSEFSIESCDDAEVCNIVTKREYTVKVTFMPSKFEIKNKLRRLQ